MSGYWEDRSVAGARVPVGCRRCGRAFGGLTLIRNPAAPDGYEFEHREDCEKVAEEWNSLTRVLDEIASLRRPAAAS